VKGPGAAPSARLINGLQRPRTSDVSGQPPQFSSGNGRRRSATPRLVRHIRGMRSSWSRGGRPAGRPVRLTVAVRWGPGLTVRCGTRMARPRPVICRQTKGIGAVVNERPRGWSDHAACPPARRDADRPAYWGSPALLVRGRRPAAGVRWDLNPPPVSSGRGQHRKGVSTCSRIRGRSGRG